MTTEIPIVFHNRPGSEMIYGPQGPFGYRQSEHILTTSKQELGYEKIAQIIGLSTDTEPKTVKRGVLDYMGLPRPREAVLDAVDNPGINLFVQQIQALEKEVIWIPIDNQAGQHRPKLFNLAELPFTGRISLMENVVNDNNRPFRLVLDSKQSGLMSCDIEYGAVGGESGRTFESYKYSKGEVDLQRDTIAWSRRIIVDSQFTQTLLQVLPLADFGTQSRDRFVTDISCACRSIQRFSERMCSFYPKDNTPLIVGVEGYINLNGECIFVDTDFPSVDAPRWMRGER